MTDVDMEFSQMMDKLERGEIDTLDFAIAMAQTTGTCSREIYERADELLSAKRKQKKSAGRPKTVPTEKIIKLRKKGMTQETIAQEIGVSLSTVRRELKYYDSTERIVTASAVDKKSAVSKWIDENFDSNGIIIEKCDLFPYGQRVIDVKGDEMLVYYDLMSDEVKFVYPDKNVAATLKNNKMTYQRREQ